jgi:hypothetical protein
MQQETIDRDQLMATLRAAQKCEVEDNDAHACMSQAPKKSICSMTLGILGYMNEVDSSINKSKTHV